MDNFSDLIPAELADDFVDFASDYMRCDLCETFTFIVFCDSCDSFTCQECLEAYGCDGVTPLHP
jgi:hypothetical protein